MKAILLASGNSRRYGKNKLFECFEGKELYTYTLDLVMSLSWEEIIVVTQYKKMIDDLKEKAVTVIQNENPEEGIASSIRLGVQAAKDADLMFFVCDQPFLTRETVAAMQKKFEQEPDFILCARSKERTGNPNIFPASLCKQLLGLEGDRGGKKLIQKYPEKVRYFQVEEIELKDMDYKEDFCIQR